ncbi:MAG: transcription antitermination factor NusB [Planctomycetes bacterium]|nr:transcription antitermination factor NusB [Planctomycetota bacterium]
MARRSRAREVALQLLYETDRNPQVPQGLDERFVRERLRGAELRQFAGELIGGVRAKREQLDRLVQEVAQNWSLSRMTPVDRSILRLATYEILFRDDIPPKVAVDEAIELAKRFGTADSPRFVNGILDRILISHPRDSAAQTDVQSADAEPSTLSTR